MEFFRKSQQFFVSNFLHSNFPKSRWIWGMSRAVYVYLRLHTFSSFMATENTQNSMNFQLQEHAPSCAKLHIEFKKSTDHLETFPLSFKFGATWRNILDEKTFLQPECCAKFKTQWKSFQLV